jgi:hypothetical protein
MDILTKVNGYKTYIVAIALMVWKVMNNDVAGVIEQVQALVPEIVMIVMRLITKATTEAAKK